MKSNICKIEKGTGDLEAILTESERVARYNALDTKQTLQLRLLCEEIDGLLPHIIDDFYGEFHIDFEDGVCKVCASIQIPEWNGEKKENLIALAKNKKNAEAVGIVGKIREAIENFLLDAGESADLGMPQLGFGTGYSEGVDYAYLWRLEEYRSTLKQQEETEAWDEMEKTVLTSIADDIIVGVKGKQANITVVKKFV